MKDNPIPQAGESACAPIQCPAKPPCRILVAEDDRDIRRFSAQALVGSGYQVDAAEDGATAWEVLQIKAFNLLITDNNMPGLTGVELVRKLRSAHMALPVIMATGRLPAEDLFDRYPWLQPVAMLPKPYSVKQLVGTVEAVLRKANGDRRQIVPPPDGQPTGGLRL
jgi:DNA-binding response OmpR family regulator